MHQRSNKVRRAALRALVICGIACPMLLAQPPAAMQAASTQQAPAGSPELLFDQGKRLFDVLQYPQAVPVFDSLIGVLTAGGQIQRPDILIQAYELRGRARFALDNSKGTEEDFAALLAIKPDFKLGAVNQRVVAILEAVRRVTIGQVAASMTALGEIQIDGRPYTIGPDPQMIDLTAGEHQATMMRPGYRTITQRFTVTAATVVPLALTLERVSATLTLVTVPDGVDVILDGSPQGQTKAASGPGELSAPLVLNELQTGAHRLQLRRDCYKDLERTITIEKPDDITPAPLRLTPAIASVRIQSSDPAAAVFLDGAVRGSTPDLTVCEGSHAIEVRGAKGRFIDRRDWKTGDTVTLTAELRSAFPVVAIKGATGVTADQLRTTLERALAPARRLLVYAPPSAELDAALRGETIPPDWLAVDPSDGTPVSPRVPKEAKRDLGRKIAAKLGAQGVSAITVGTDPYLVSVSLLAAGSSEPDVVTINLADPASQTRSVAILSGLLSPIVGPSIDTAVVDLAGVQGAVVVRVSGAGAKAGLTQGDIIVGAGGRPVVSVADLRARISAIHPPAPALSLDVKGPGGAQRKVDVTVGMVADTLPLRDPAVLYNLALLDLQDAAVAATTPLEQSAAHLNLAIVHMRLGDWDDALAELKKAPLADGSGVSAGTVAYLTGQCLENLGRTAEARDAFVKAAASPLARLANDGPLVAPLAQQKLAR